MFKVGDKVRCVNRDEKYPHGLIIDGEYIIRKVGTGKDAALVWLEDYGCGFFASRFKLVYGDQLHNIPKSNQPYPYPEDDESRERKAVKKLRAYKKGMRDFLYGTTSEGEEA